MLHQAELLRAENKKKIFFQGRVESWQLFEATKLGIEKSGEQNSTKDFFRNVHADQKPNKSTRTRLPKLVSRFTKASRG
jgi:hypothetical protein